MDAFDYAEPRKASPPKDNTTLIWNILTAILLVGALCIGVVFLMIFTNPQSGLNPFPPPTQVVAMQFPTSTPTPRLLLPPTWTPVPYIEPTSTPTLFPSTTPLPSNTPYGLPTEVPTKGPSPTPTPGGMSFIVMAGYPKGLPNIGHTDMGCNWMGVAGQVKDLSQSPISGLTIQLGGTLEGKVVEQLTLTGLATQYGQGGFEFTIADHTVASHGTLWLQLLDQAGLPLSNKTYFDTYPDCEKNLVLIYFTQVK